MTYRRRRVQSNNAMAPQRAAVEPAPAYRLTSAQPLLVINTSRSSAHATFSSRTLTMAVEFALHLRETVR